MLIYAIAQELSAATRQTLQTLLAASQLDVEYVSILDNLSMLGVRVESVATGGGREA